MVTRDINGQLKEIIRKGRLEVAAIIYSKTYSKTKMRKLGLIHNKYKKKKT